MNLAIVQKYQHLKKQVGNRVLFTLLLTTLMIIATMFITDSWLNDITDSNKQAKADYLKMSRVSQIRTQIERAESAQRGYLLSQDERYLPIYTDSKGNVLTQLQQLSTLLNTSNTDPQEQALFHQINSDIGAKISEMDITITLIENARTAQALDLVRMNQGQLLQNNIRTNVQSLYSLIEQRLNELIAKRSEKIKWARWSILLTILILSAVILITLILSFFTLVFGELVPKRIAMKQSEKVALNISGLITVISKLFAPIVWLLSASTNGILRLLGIDPNEAEEQVGEEDIRMMVDASSEHGGIDHEEKEFIQNVFEFDDLTAEEIATHRTDVDLLWLDDTMDDWAETIHNTRHTRYPVCEDSADNVVGILNAKEYFRLADKSRESVMAGAVRTPYFVPETIKADALFRNMKRTGNPLAVVLDEYGGMVGIVTLNDLVEELVGDLGSDDSNIPDDDEPRIEKREDGSLVITGNVELDDLEDALGIELDQEEHDTLTGLVFDALGMIPDDGPQDITLEAEGMRIHVTSILDHQVNAAEVTLLPQTEDADEAKE